MRIERKAVQALDVMPKDADHGSRQRVTLPNLLHEGSRE